MQPPTAPTTAWCPATPPTTSPLKRPAAFALPAVAKTSIVAIEAILIRLVSEFRSELRGAVAALLFGLRVVHFPSGDAPWASPTRAKQKPADRSSNTWRRRRSPTDVNAKS